MRVPYRTTIVHTNSYLLLYCDIKFHVDRVELFSKIGFSKKLQGNDILHMWYWSFMFYESLRQIILVLYPDLGTASPSRSNKHGTQYKLFMDMKGVGHFVLGNHTCWNINLLLGYSSSRLLLTRRKLLVWWLWSQMCHIQFLFKSHSLHLLILVLSTLIARGKLDSDMPWWMHENFVMHLSTDKNIYGNLLHNTVERK